MENNIIVNVIKLIVRAILDINQRVSDIQSRPAIAN